MNNMNKVELNFDKNFFNSKSSNINRNLRLLMLKEEDKLLSQLKKNRFISKISLTELDLYKKDSRLKPLDPQHNITNKKILNQIKNISKKIFENNSQEKERKRKMFHDILFIQKDNNINQNSHNYILRHNSLNKVSFPKNSNLIIKTDKKKEKKYINLSTKKEEKEKINLPPINRFKYCVKKLKLNINNESSTNKFDEEQMMNMYKELELYNKNKFVF
jgi:hypothetical protein